MAVSKSIIEDFELSTGTQVYVQAHSNPFSSRDRISLSFDSSEGGFNIGLSSDEAAKLSKAINKVIKEQKNGTGK